MIIFEKMSNKEKVFLLLNFWAKKLIKKVGSKSYPHMESGKGIRNVPHQAWIRLLLKMSIRMCWRVVQTLIKNHKDI